MNTHLLQMFYKVSRLYRLEVSYKLGINQQISRSSLDFIKNWKGSDSYTDPFDDTYLQIIVWNGSKPIAAFREHVRAVEQGESFSLKGFFARILNYYLYTKTCKHDRDDVNT